MNKIKTKVDFVRGLMSDEPMEIVIKISEETYNSIKNGMRNRDCMEEVGQAVEDGISLPKGHGDLVDLNWIDQYCPDYRTDDDGSYCYKWADISQAPPIIKADKGEQE